MNGDRMKVDRLVRFSRELLGLEIPPEAQRAFGAYADRLLEWNARVNLTAITDPEAIEVRHFLDSLTVVLATRFTPGQRVIDVGTGAGFPGIPLRLIYPFIQLTLLEATAKKTEFLSLIVEQLHLDNVRVLTSRAEDAGQAPATREQYDLVLARAVAQMPVLGEYMLPLCRVGGQCIALKGENAAAEIQQAEDALRILGGRVKKLVPVELPQVTETHYLVIVEKVAATPPKYPRRAGMPSKRPL